MILHEMIDESGYGTAHIDYMPKLQINWERRFFFLPRKTIGGKWRAGYLYWYATYYRNPPTEYTYATPKEYFVWKMKNNE